MTDTLAWTIAIALAYLIGSIPFGYLVARAKGIDIRAHGSGNIGATNVSRVLGKRLGRAVFVLDFLKGALPVLGAGLVLGAIGSPPPAPAVALMWVGVAIATILGHVFPIYLRFKGGKGVATTFGALIALWPFVTIACFLAMVLWVIVLKVTRYVSVASCAAACALPAGVLAAAAAGLTTPASGVAAWAQIWPFAAATTLIAALVVARHRGNLARVRAGTEPKVGAGRSANPGAASHSPTTPGSGEAEKA
jgi:glycerol-3-phosphate acyltransferase PlsY